MNLGTFSIPNEEIEVQAIIGRMRELKIFSSFVLQSVKKDGVSFLEEHAKTVMGSCLEEK